MMMSFTDITILGALAANIALLWYRIGRLEGRLGKKIDEYNGNPGKKEKK